jgi:aspartate/glutamate racemase
MTLAQDELVFLHTMALHVPTFTRLAQEIAPGIAVRHVVNQSLLDNAREFGLTGDVRESVQEAMRQAAGGGARVVVCTCSTVGGLAETMQAAGFLAMRIDRAMADAAVRGGRRIAVLATLASTLEPTRELLVASAQAAGVEPEYQDVLVKGAWGHFESGDRAAFLDSIVRAIREARASADVIVLAQASMADAADLAGDVGIPVLSSPVLGARAAIAAAMAGR